MGIMADASERTVAAVMTFLFYGLVVPFVVKIIA